MLFCSTMVCVSMWPDNLINFIPGYVTYLCDNYPAIVNDGISDSTTYLQNLSHHLSITNPPVFVDCKYAAELFINNCDLSQRGYKNLKQVLKNKNIQMPKYSEVREYMNNMDIGVITENYAVDQSNHMCISTDLRETLQHILSSELLSHCTFFDTETQLKLFDFLKTANSNIYQNLDATKRTLILRQTGDNFRGAARHPTEQISFCLLNIGKLVDNPHGQFIQNLWRGAETRIFLEEHLAMTWMKLCRTVYRW